MYHYRFSYEPILGEDGKPIEAEIGHLDDARFQALAPYEYLTADYISALAGLKGKNGKPTTDRFGLLKVEPNRWVDIAEPMMARQRRYRLAPLAYSLNPKSLKHLRKNGKE